jgi:hypothetical protein
MIPKNAYWLSQKIMHQKKHQSAMTSKKSHHVLRNISRRESKPVRRDGDLVFRDVRSGVKTGNPQTEQFLSANALEADIHLGPGFLN